jgi:hypothetical protein
MEDNNTTENILDLGAWLGRKQAFTLLAGRNTLDRLIR